MSGDQLLSVLTALGNPHRMRIVSALQGGGRNYVSQLARQIGISRPLMHLHLQKLEKAGLVESQFEVSDGGKALNYFTVKEFTIPLTPDLVFEAAKSLSVKSTKSN